MSDRSTLASGTDRLRAFELQSRLAGGAVSLLSLVALLLVPFELWPVALPLVALVNIGAWFAVTLSRRDSALPVFELGSVCVAFTLIYTAYPLFAFVMSGGTWSALTDNRLQQWNPDARELGAFAWGYVLYLAAFAGAYLPARGRISATGIPMNRLSNAGTLVLVWLALGLLTYFVALWVLARVTYTPSYADVRQGVVGLPGDLPYVVQQLSHNLKGILVLLKICGIAILMARWRTPFFRWLLIAWLSVEAVTTATRMGARSEAMFLLVSTVLLYHRVVRPLRFRQVAVAGLCLLSLVLAYGFARDFKEEQLGAEPASYWSAANEFQVIMGTGFDLQKRREVGALDSVPWQVQMNEILLLVPRQLLPVEKIDPAEWYLAEIGLDSRQGGLMFGVMAQAAVGYGRAELILRGALLGILFGILHRLYVRRARSYWWTIFYLYLCLWSYYTIRASTFYFVYVVAYRFVPVVAVIGLGAWLVRRAANGSPAGRSPALIPQADVARLRF